MDCKSNKPIPQNPKPQKPKLSTLNMKKPLILFLLFTILSCTQSPPENIKSTTTTTKSVDYTWLLGNWKRVNEKEGKETFETWDKISDTEYAGIGYTMQKGDTISQEKMRLTKSGEHWDIIVSLGQEVESVIFKGESHTDTEFVFVNPENDFPNKIKYWKSGDKLLAAISSTEMEISFEFEKISN